MAQRKIDVSTLDFDQIRQSLKDHLKGQSEFKDYDFEGSGMSVLIDLLAQNTYQNAFYNNMIVNESFIDTAIRRENLTSKAKMVGYTPRSAKSAKAILEVKIVPSDNPSSITIFKGAKFTTKIDGSTYTFITEDDTIVFKNPDDEFVAQVNVAEGYIIEYNYTHNRTGKRTYEILDPNIDTDTIEVDVRPDFNSTDIVPYLKASDLTAITPDTTQFFLEENTSGRYQIVFGDDVLGKNPEQDAGIKITGRICSANLPNGASVFSPQGYIAHNTGNPTVKYTASSVFTIQPAKDGQTRESIESIRFNAPKFYTRQNRNVTSSDYESFLIEKYSDLQAVSVWGGENNIPPIYGKCFVCAKPFDGYNLTIVRKLEIVEQLKKYNVLTIEPVIVDAAFTFIKPSIIVKYNPEVTTLGPDGLANKIAEKLITFERDNLGTFSRSFRSSRLLGVVDDSDASIVSSGMTMLIEKRFNPRINENVSYTVIANAQVYHPYDGILGAISSSRFKCTLTNLWCQIVDDGFGNINLISMETGVEVMIKKNIGTIDYSNGILKFNGVIITDHEEDSISIFMKPKDIDYTPVRNMIVLFSAPRIEIIDANKNEITYVGTAETQGSFNVALQDASNVLV